MYQSNNNSYVSQNIVGCLQLLSLEPVEDEQNERRTTDFGFALGGEKYLVVL